MKILLFIFCFPLLSHAALQCNGTTSFMGTSGATTNLGGANFTVTCWFKRLGTGTTASSGSGGIVHYPLVTKGGAEADGSNVDCAYTMGINSTSNTLSADYEDFGTGLNHPVFGRTFIASNVWYHAAAVFNSNTFRVFLNGIQDGSVTLTNIPRFDSIQKFGIGGVLTSTGAPSGSWAGMITEVAVWNSALSDAAIYTLAQSRIARLPFSTQASTLVGYWPLDDLGDGLTFVKAFDRSRNNNPCFGSNAPLARAEQILSTP